MDNTRPITEELIRHYSSVRMWMDQDFVDPQVKSLVTSLALTCNLARCNFLTKTAHHITATLNMCEPLEEVASGSEQAHLLIITYRWYVRKDEEGAIEALKEALQRYPESTVFQRLADGLGVKIAPVQMMLV